MLTQEQQKSLLIEKVIKHIHDKLEAKQASVAEVFVRQYYQRVAPEDLTDRTESDLYGAALSHWQFALKRPKGKRLIRVYNPRLEEHAWQSTHTIVEMVQDDMPFLVDSARIELNRRGLTVHLIIHPVLHVSRDSKNELTEVLPEDTNEEGALREAFMHFEVDRHADVAMLESIEKDLTRVMEDVRAAVEDWPKMRDRLQCVVAELNRRPLPFDPEDITEDKAFLAWLDRDHFTFAGYREYVLEKAAEEDVLRIVPGSGLGVLRIEGGDLVSHSFAQLPPEARKLARKPELLILTKSNSKATVHLPGYLDYVGIKQFNDQGAVIGEWRFLGLYTTTAYNERPEDIPVLRRKVQYVMRTSDLREKSHSYKALLNILDTLPRQELFQSSEEELYQTATRILHLQERQRVRLLIRHDSYGRFLSCLVYLPRDRFNTDVRVRIQEILRQTFNASSLDFTVWLSESVLARIYFIVHTVPGTFAKYDFSELEARITTATHTWEDQLNESLNQKLGEELGNRLFACYRFAFPASYREDYPASVAVDDIQKIEALNDAEPLGMALYRPLEIPQGMIRFKLFRAVDPISLSVVLPMLENMGVYVVDERPHEILPSDAPSVWVHDLGLTYEQNGQLDDQELRNIFQEAFAKIWHGVVENDGFNRLVLKARLPWRRVMVLRACCKFLRQTGFPFSQPYMEQTLANHPQIASLLVDLFTVRFDPSNQDQAEKRSDSLKEAILQSLDAVPTLDEDRIQRRFFILIQSMLRTNYFQTGIDGEPKDYFSFKLDPTQLPDLPEPRPHYEIFVYSTRMEGVHLRGGKVARGGIRWSDRLEDFRTEIFDLMKTQMVKNAVIVPVGAKGGFVVKRPPSDQNSESLIHEVKLCYGMLIRGLLDITDNIIDGNIASPSNVVHYDEDDPYLVVAADKGTATFSDAANSIAKEYDFWLGDAFASGGSAGYDHKKMGITARGAWESVKRHFREMNVDIQSTEFTVVGIGSMSGDVFGNGMLLSRHIKLVAAFSHSHIFLDPDPDPEHSYLERERLFHLPRSSWFDYDKAKLSKGGGIYPRTLKSIPLTQQVKKSLDIHEDSLHPNELIRAILKAPVDLLWNGGIGTFIKAHYESHVEVGDRTNDAIRVDAKDLRCKVISEGGNLGLTYDARIEYALKGGRINPDFIDNSGGVDCSDHEVNIKILLNEIVKKGDLSEKQRNQLLFDMTEEVASLVIRNNYQQTESLSMSEHHAAGLLDEHTRFMRNLEKAGRLERSTWHLPDDEELVSRRSDKQGLTRPELAVLLAYSKIDLYEALIASDICEDAYLANELIEYFPTPLRERFKEQMQLHRLRREIIATVIANSMINHMGITFPFRIAEHTGAVPGDIARAYMATRKVFDLPSLWSAISELDNLVSSDHQMSMLADARELSTRSTLWFLRNRKQPLDIAAAIEAFSPGVEELSYSLAEILDSEDYIRLKARADSYVEHDIPEEFALKLAGLPPLFSALDITEVSATMRRPVAMVGKLLFSLGAQLEINWLRDQISTLPEDSHWIRLASVAMREDLYRLHRTLTREALLLSPDIDDPAQILNNWMEANQTTISRYLQRLGDFKIAGNDFALLSVSINEVRKLIQTTGAPTGS